jgi:hypothetical protein
LQEAQKVDAKNFQKLLDDFNQLWLETYEKAEVNIAKKVEEEETDSEEKNKFATMLEEESDDEEEEEDANKINRILLIDIHGDEAKKAVSIRFKIFINRPICEIYPK